MHARGRPIVECEAYDRVSDSVIVKPGILMQVSKNKITVSIPTANVPLHKFSPVSANGYGYEGSMLAPRGWRIRLDQLESKDGVTHLSQHQGTNSMDSQAELAVSADQGHPVQPVP